MTQIRDGIRSAAKRGQSWLRSNRRLERGLHRATKLQGPTTRFSHQLIVPMNSTYSPWYDDQKFRDAYDRIGGHTFVDQYKCYELWEQLAQLGHVDGDVLEVGVWRGGTGVLMARRVADLGFDATVYLADTFEGVVKASEDDPWYQGGEHSDTSPEIVRSLARSLGVDVELLVGIFPDDTADQIADVTLRMVHIDVDVYRSAREVLEWAWPRLSVGGVVVWDDYGSFECEGVVQLGQELMAGQDGDTRLVHNINGHLLMFKLADGALNLPALAS